MCVNITKAATDSRDYFAFLTPAVSFILGFVIAVFSEPLRQWLFRPVLRVSFEKNDSCVAHTPVENGGKEYEAYYIRVKVENTRRHLAKACRAFLIQVEEKDESGYYKPTLYADSLPLAWSCQKPDEARKPIDLPLDVAQFVDVVATDSLSNNYFVQVSPLPFRYHKLFEKKPKDFRITVLVSGDGVKPATTRIIFRWKGTWNDFEVSKG
jgi:hypothetical protein